MNRSTTVKSLLYQRLISTGTTEVLRKYYESTTLYSYISALYIMIYVKGTTYFTYLACACTSNLYPFYIQMAQNAFWEPPHYMTTQNRVVLVVLLHKVFDINNLSVVLIE